MSTEILVRQDLAPIFDLGLEPEELLTAFIEHHGIKGRLEPEVPSLYGSKASLPSQPPEITDGD